MQVSFVKVLTDKLLGISKNSIGEQAAREFLEMPNNLRTYSLSSPIGKSTLPPKNKNPRCSRDFCY